jgi:tetratricopeptide (TPR) repeat protein
MLKRLYQGHHREVAVALNNLGQDYRGLSEPRRARDVYKEALALLRHLYPGDNLDTAVCLENLAIVEDSLGNEKRSRRYREQAKAIRARLEGKSFGMTI